MSVEIPILLFGPDLPVAGHPTVCVLEQDHLYLPTYKHAVRFTELEARIGSFDHNQLQLCWQFQDQSWLLIPSSLETQKTLINALPKQSVNGLHKWQRATLGQSLVWKTAIYSACTLALAAILLVWQYDTAITWVAGQVSLATENKIGQSVLTSLKSQSTLIDKGIAVDAVKKIGDRLTKNSAYKYQWHLSNDPAINAFALPGGIVIVNKGLLEKADSPNEVAGVLAHEIQHVEQRHALKNMIISSGIAAGVLLVLGDANAVMMILAHQVSAQYFSRQAESDADMKGIALLQKSKIDTQGMVTFFKKMQEAFKGKANGPEWMSSHPDTANRIQAIENYIKGHLCADCEKLKWDKKAILASLGKEKTNAK
ncbi:MAG: M48 family metallopeptidase [Methyloglobulus sp.]|nr:M48 family metallopeptidase [Methyloglobulus sp.]